ncbi:MAG: class I SAM-dependent methyltransferase [Thermodesulfobacteriota bacterium]
MEIVNQKVDEVLNKVTIEDFAQSFGTATEDIPETCRRMIWKKDFRYRIIEGSDRDQLILDVLRKTDEDRQTIGVPERRDVWQKGWDENLQNFAGSGLDLNTLVPKFIRPNQVIRFNRNYIMPVDPDFELNYFSVFRTWLFDKYFEKFHNVYDFGCGSGLNLASLAQLYPHKSFHGLDFVPSSKDLINRIGAAHSWDMKGHLFDMIHPDENIDIEEDSVVCTFGAIEQLASQFEAFLQFLLKRSPSLCVHVEPTVELYDETSLIDYLAIRFHKKRGYTENFLPRLRELEALGRIRLLKVKRLFFGSLLMEGYSLIIWTCAKGD